MNLPTRRQIQIVIDDREVRSGIVTQLHRLEGVAIIVRRLPVGDYLIDGKLLVERKTMVDFAASIVDGRLFKQASRLNSQGLQIAIILEGIAQDISRIHVRREAVQGAIVSLAVKFGIPLLRSSDPAESARLLVFAAMQLGKSPPRNLPRPGTRPKTRRELQLHILQGLPGVGPERAGRLLDAFDSVEAAITAPVDQLMEVRGVGRTTALAIRRAVAKL